MQPSRISALLCTGLLAAAVTACGGSSSPSSSASGGSKPTEEKIVYINSSGGDLDKVFRDVFWDPFTKATGIKVVNTAPVNQAKLAAMVTSGNVEWDITEVSGGGDFPRNIKAGYFEKIDTSKLPLTDLPKDAVSEYGVWDAPYATILAWDLKKWPMSGKHPTGIKDLWNQTDFPGKRCIQKGALDNLEFAVINGGATRATVYPIDQDRAYRELDKLKPHVGVYWGSGAQSVQAITDGECVMGTAWNGRPYEVNKSGERLGIAWEDANLKVSWWAVPRGAKHPGNAVKLLAYMMDPKGQAKMAEGSGYAGANLKTGDYVSEAVKPYFATTPEHLATTLVSDDAWWEANGVAAEKRFTRWVTR